jgi:predicted PurR-regulated permease PerM
MPPTESPHWTVATKSIIAAAALVLLGLLVWQFRSLIQPIVIAVLIAYLVNPLVAQSTQRLKLSRGAAVLLVYAIFLVAITAVVTGIGFVSVDQGKKLVEIAPEWLTKLSEWLRTNLTAIELTVAGQVYQINLSPEQLDLGALANQLLSYAQPALSGGSSLAAQVASTTFDVISTGFLILFISIYLSKDGPLFERMIGDVAQAPGYRADAERLSRDFVRIWDAYLRGQVILAVIMFFLVSLVLTAMGLNFSLGLGVLSGLMEFLPVIGPLIATVAAALVALFQDSNWFGLSPLWYTVAIIGVMFALQQIEAAVLVPRFVGEALDLHPVTVIVVVVMGTSLAGILGAVLAAPVAASIKLLGGYAWRKMFDLPPFVQAEETQQSPPVSWRARLAAFAQRARGRT